MNDLSRLRQKLMPYIKIVKEKIPFLTEKDLLLELKFYFNPTF